MKRTVLMILAHICASLSIGADVVIDSVTPNHGPASGGTVVTIRGSGFFSSGVSSPVPPPPRIQFGSVEADYDVINENTIRAVTPAHLPAIVDVSVHGFGLIGNKGFTLRDGFTFEGQPPAEYERILLPLFLAEVEGAYGTSFKTVIKAMNTAQCALLLYGAMPCLGLESQPTNTFCFPDSPARPWHLAARETADLTLDHLVRAPNGTPGQFLWIARNARRNLALQARVVTRGTEFASYGAAIPTVYEEDFRTHAITLVDVPNDPAFRKTLRIYAPRDTTVTVRAGSAVHTVALTGATNIFRPASATLGDAELMGANSVSIVPSADTPVWAFIAVTHNTTQLVTVIAPK